MIADRADLKADVLLGLVAGRIKENLERQAIDAIRPAVRQAIDEVLAELKPSIETYMDHLKRETVIRLVTHEIPA